MMRSNRQTFIILFLLAFYFPVHVIAQSYKDNINAWYQTRSKSLTADNGWLNLVGLFWLKEGKNSFGSGDDVDLHFPSGSTPAALGYFELKGDTVLQHINKNGSVTVNGKIADEEIVYRKDILPAPVSTYENLKWTIIKRGDKIGVRLRNLKAGAVTNFKGIDHYKADSSWVITATLLSTPGLNNISITNILGQVQDEKSPGKLHFTLQGKEYTLDALEENNKLFIIFADATSGETTYPTGRFLIAEKTTDGGTTVLDFNKAYNPPCAFSSYATCPIPPKQNVLPIAVTAGEKTYGQH